MRARRFFNVSAGILCLAMASHEGARDGWARPVYLSSGLPLTPGNLLFADRDTIREFTLGGHQVRAAYVPPGDGVEYPREFARNMAIDERGLVHVYNGTFRPWISTWDPVADSWSHLRVPGLSTAGYAAGGGICASGDYLYATDVSVASSPDRGLVQVSLRDGTVTRFAADRDYDDIDIGPGGLLYGLDHNQGQVRVFDPLTLAQVGYIPLPAFCTSIVVAPDGTLFGATYSGGGLRHIGRDGSLLAVVGTGNCAMTSIDRFASGVIIATGFCGRVFVTDEGLHTPDQFTADPYGGEVAAIPLSLGNQAPDCSGATASVHDLWPPDHDLVPVEILSVTDPDGDPVSVTVTGVTQDEPPLAPGGGNTCPDALLDGGLRLRAERSGTGNGRVYVVSFAANDGRGGVCEGAVNVCVPHDRGPEPEVAADPGCARDGDPQAYDSLEPCAARGRGIAEPMTAAVSLEGRAVRGNLALVAYSLTHDGEVSLAVYDLTGRRVALVEAGPRSAGVHEARWDSSALSPGMYFYGLRAGGAVVSKAVLILR